MHIAFTVSSRLLQGIWHTFNDGRLKLDPRTSNYAGLKTKRSHLSRFHVVKRRAFSVSWPGNLLPCHLRGDVIRQAQNCSRVQSCEQVEQRRDKPCPSRLMAGAKPGAILAMKVLVEQDVIPPLRVFLEFLGASVNRPPVIFIAKKDAGQAQRNLLRHLKQRHVFSGTSWTFHFEIVTVKGIHVQQAPYDQNVDWHPNRSSPI